MKLPGQACLQAKTSVVKLLLPVLWCTGFAGNSLGQDSAQDLIATLRSGDISSARELLTQAIDVNASYGDGSRALHWATYQNETALVEQLIVAGADVNAATDLAVTPLKLACDNGNAEIVSTLLVAGADPNVTLESGETALMSCARIGSVEAVQALLEFGADVNATEREENQSALMWAVSQSHPTVVEQLLRNGADVNARSKERRWVISRRLQSNLIYGELGRNYGTDAEETRIGGFTPILFAARQGGIESARLLLQAGAEVNDKAPDGRSVLLLAAHSNHGDFARFVLEQGANPNSMSAGYSALHAAVMTGDIELLKALLEKGARPNTQVTLATRVTRNGQVLMLGDHLLGATPLALAAKYIELEHLQELLNHGADPNLVLKNGWSPLMLATGASWRYKIWDRRDRALAHELAMQAEMYNERGTLRAITTLIEGGADINAIDEDGSTVLHYAVDKGFNSVLEYLAQNGVDIDAKNNRGRTALDLVSGYGLTGNVEAADATQQLLKRLSLR
jgi:uncharacterized protein